MSKDKKKIVLKIQEESLKVYDEVSKNLISLFPNDEEGLNSALYLIRELAED